MRAATRKPLWYIRRGLTVPAEVIQYRMKMVMKKERRLEQQRVQRTSSRRSQQTETEA